MAKPSGVVYLCKDVPLSVNSSHTIDFKNPSEQKTYLGSFVKYTINNVSYVRRSRQYIAVDKPLVDLQDINYLYFKAVEDGKIYYCYVIDKEYVGEKSTYLYFETDVLQTYMFDYEFKPSFVVQEHVDRWDINHKPIFSRTDEGLDYGSEYQLENAFKIIQGERENFSVTDQTTNQTITYKDVLEKYAIVLCKQHSNLIGEGSNALEPTYIQGAPNPYIIYIVPVIGKRVVYATLDNPEGSAYQIANLKELTSFMATSSFGEYIHQIVILPYLPLDYDLIGEGESASIQFSSGDDTSAVVTTITNEGRSINLLRVREINDLGFKKLLAEMPIEQGIESAYPTEEQWLEVKLEPYDVKRDRRFESKLLCYPYRYNLLTDWRNGPLLIKNEYLTGDKIKVHMVGSFGFNAPFRYYIANYKGDPEGRNNSINQTMQIDYPVVTDAYYNYLLTNKNQLFASAATLGERGGWEIAKSMVGGAVAGGPAGGLTSLLSGLTTAGDVIIDARAFIRTEGAKQADIRNYPDSIIGSNESSINILDDNTMLSFYRYKICCEFEEQLADIFHMTGYTVKRVKVPNLRSRLRFNYIRTSGANIIGSFNQSDLAKIRAYYDNGLTIWHYLPHNHFTPFDYSYENIETSLAGLDDDPDAPIPDHGDIDDDRREEDDDNAFWPE